ncbi:MAG TPA: UbiA family prenyltransferase [Thermoanaerobaculia bacterium]|nr:UbiA family prenyltransferase [Thermoanaerobaculia bacterium]
MSSTALRYLACLRPQDILVLQGTPLLGAAFAVRDAGVVDLAALATLTLANILLVTHIFMLNDWAGLTTDLADPHKAAHVFTAKGVGRGEIGGLAAGFLIASLWLFSRLSPLTLGIAVAIAMLSALYSLPPFHWKGRPVANSITHLAGGILHFLLGYSLQGRIDYDGVAVASFFALIFAAGHLAQEVRDHKGDALSGIRTNAVRFGPRRTFIASLVLFTLANAVFAALALTGTAPRPLAALVMLHPLQLYWSSTTLAGGLTYASVSRLQSRYRALYAVMGIAIVAALLFA